MGNNMAVEYLMRQIQSQEKELDKLRTVADELANERDYLLTTQGGRNI